MKISIVLLSLFCFSVSLFSVEEYYRSNSNGVLLLQIEAIDRHEYEYVIQRDFNEMEQETTRTLWKKNVAEKSNKKLLMMNQSSFFICSLGNFIAF